LPGKPVAERGLFRRQAGGVQLQAGARELGQMLQLIGVIPNQAEMFADLVDQPGRGRAAAAVLQGREIGRGDLQRRRHVPLQYAARCTQLPQFGAERRHGRTPP
jgi:hypothetical protein